MSKIFFGGSRALSRLNDAIETRLQNVIDGNHTVLIGDANGADKAIQRFFAEAGYRNLIVYCMEGVCRNNVGNWNVRSVHSEKRKKDFSYFALKDQEMSREAEHGCMFWDGKSKGALNNVLNMLQQGKTSLIYFAPRKAFITVKTPSNLDALLSYCDSKSQAYFDKTIHLSERSNTLQVAMHF